MRDFQNDRYCQIMILAFFIFLTLSTIVCGGILIGISNNDILNLSLGFGFVAFGGISGLISVLEYMKIKEKKKNETK